MGDIPLQDTHVKRSSSLSFALRWKHDNMKRISIVSAVSFAATLLFLLLLYGTSFKTVTLVLNGNTQEVQTNQWVLQKLLDEQAITVGDHDRLSAAPDSKIHDGEKIVIDQATPIVVTSDGETRTLYTIGKDIGSALSDLNIQVGEEDKVSLPLDTPVTAFAQLQIVRVKKEMDETTEPIAFDVEERKDSNLTKGKEQVVQEGQEGVLLKKIEKVYEDGVLVSEDVVDQSVQSESVNKIVAIGTKNPVTVLSASSPAVDQVSKSGITFDTKKILKNVTLTAYSAGPASTGKSTSNPQFGITRSGTRATEGRTIAVDPSVIPLGWWVYIDGLGFRRAEDTGSAVKGNTIDVYYDNESYASRFGTKRGYTVYVVGPTKPSAD